jgi:hypothetical protein
MPTNDELQQARGVYDDAKTAHERAQERNKVYSATQHAKAADTLIATQQARIEELEAWKQSAMTVFGGHFHIFQDILAPYARIGDDPGTTVGRVLARIAELEGALKTADRRVEYVLDAAHTVLEDIFMFPVNGPARVYLLGYDEADFSRRRIMVQGDTEQDVLRLKGLVDELQARADAQEGD